MSSDEPPVPAVPSVPKKRATVAQVDRKLDELTEQLDIMCSDIKDIKQVMKTYIELRIKESEIPKPKDDDNDRMYG